MASGRPPVHGVAMTGQHPVRGQAIERRERVDGEDRIDRERSQRGTDDPGRHRARGHRVADEDGVDQRDVERDRPRGVARQPDDSRRSGHVEDGARGERRDLGDRRAAQAAVRRGVRQEADHRADAHRIPSGARLLCLAARLGGIGSVDPDGHAMVAPQALCESDMVDVAVGQQDRRDVVERAAHGVELGREILPEAGQTGIDDRHPTARLRRGSC